MILLAAAAHAQPEAVWTFDAALAALEGGERVRAVVHTGACLRDGEPGPDGVLGFDLAPFESVAKGAIGNPAGLLTATSERWIPDPKRGLVRSVTWFELYDDGRVDLVVHGLDPKTQKVLTTDRYGCALGANSGVALYVDRAGR